MTSQINLSKFNEVYDKTYNHLLKYVIVKCHNINDANDILQETYLELWNILHKKTLMDTNIKSYLYSIANNKIKKHYSLIQRLKTISLFDKNNDDIELIDTIADKININDIIINNDNWKIIWEYLKKQKNQDIPKIFYLYYTLELTIKEISQALNVSESYTKHLIYRTLHELQRKYGNGGNSHD